MILTVILLILFFSLIIYKIHIRDNECTFFDMNSTNIMKGLCCIIVVFVHILPDYQNSIQDMVGSFAYICVTLFMLFSAYGLFWSIKNKENYMDNFIRNRFLIVSVPFIISVLVKKICGFDIYSGGTKFLIIMLILYLLTYITFKFLKGKEGFAISLIAVLYSFIGYSTNIGIGWYVEVLGFAYGIILSYNIDKLKLFLTKKFWLKFLVITLFSGFLGIMYLKFKYIPFIGSYFLKVILGGILVFWVLMLMYKFVIENKLIKVLGHISYEIYLIHGFVMSGLMLLDNIWVKGNISSGIFIVITFTITICLSLIIRKINLLLYKIIRKNS